MSSFNQYVNFKWMGIRFISELLVEVISCKISNTYSVFRISNCGCLVWKFRTKSFLAPTIFYKFKYRATTYTQIIYFATIHVELREIFEIGKINNLVNRILNAQVE